MFNIMTEISDATLGIGPSITLGEKYELRKTARAILLNNKGEMATVFLARDNFHKLPGGGLEADEDLETALKREIMEETGCNCTILNKIGVVMEYRSKYHLLQISYGFVAQVVGEIGTPKLEDKEVEEGLKLEWLTADIALEKMKQEKPDRYESHFILAREIAFIETYLAATK